ncbi:MAG: ABC transporter permease [Saprospiraceae bacterium]|nr:ABC transporter permease [Saprospiraceae bacterium]
MNIRQFIIKTLTFYWRQNLTLSLGIAISTAVLTGALIVGDSIQYSLSKIVQLRLGEITHTFSAVDRYFSASLAFRLENEIGDPVASLLMLEGMASSQGGKYQIPRVQVLGVDQKFPLVTGSPNFILPRSGALISRNLADRLNLNENDELLIRIKKLSVIPLNAPFVSDADLVTSVTLIIAGILTDENMGRFDLKNIQTAPYNIMLSLELLNELMDTGGKANYLLISSDKHSEIETALPRIFSLEDYNLKSHFNALQNSWDVTSDRVFMDPVIQEVLTEEPVSAEAILTYFTNSISSSGRETPYSFVSSLEDTGLALNEIVITDWLAEDLDADLDDTIALEYFVIGALRALEEKLETFVIKRIVSLSGKWADASLMPPLPGLTDVGNCRDWETGVPIDLEKIREKDEAYWDTFRGIPKAYVSYRTARNLWSNRFGESTALRINSPGVSAAEIDNSILEVIQPKDLGFRVQEVRSQADLAAKSGVDFSQLFLGLSFFLLFASLLLTILLFSLNTSTRMDQLGTLSFLGFTRRKIKALWLVEGLLVAIAGSVVGLWMAIGYNNIVFKALNTIWLPIVRTSSLETDISISSLVLGFGISVLISFLAILISLNRLLKQPVHQLQIQKVLDNKKRAQAIRNVTAYIVGITGISLVIWSYWQHVFQNTIVFFASGALLLISFLLLVHGLFHRKKVKMDPMALKAQRLISQNITNNPRQSFLVVAMFAIGTFIIVATGAHRQDLFSNAQEKTSGTGGFLLYGTCTVPILNNLNDPKVRFISGLEKDYQIVQLKEYPGDDASCLNLNRTINPGILGVEPEAMIGRYHFVDKIPMLHGENPWSSLHTNWGGNVIPAIADQSVIQWGLGLKVGDTLQYRNEQGELLNLKLVGGLANSIFQGSILIASDHFLTHFPSNSGSTIFLVEGETEEQKSIVAELQNSLRDHGLDLQASAERLATFNAVQNTYLSIFLILGGLGLILGTLGLAVVVARNLLNRKKELGIMQATGFSNKLILSLITQEHLYLLFTGVGIGLISAILATLPSWLNSNIDMSPKIVLILIGLIFLNGTLWILWITRRFLTDEKVINALRGE